MVHSAKKNNHFNKLFIVSDWDSINIIAQNETAQVKDSTGVQTTTTIEPVSSLTIPEGTKLMVNGNEPINTAKNPAASTFKSILEVDFIYNGKEISPKGSPVYGKIIECRGGRVLGGSKLTFQFTDIMVNGQLTPIVTDPIGVEGEKEIQQRP